MAGVQVRCRCRRQIKGIPAGGDNNEKAKAKKRSKGEAEEGGGGELWRCQQEMVKVGR